MYLKSGNSIIFDYNLNSLRDFFTLLDAKLDGLQQWIESCPDPDQMRLFDEEEYLVGIGFVVCQHYLTSTYGFLGIEKKVALDIESKHQGGRSFASILNAAANYWKHVDEWKPFVTFIDNSWVEDTSVLQENQKNTLRVIETVVSSDNCSCVSLLEELSGHTNPRFADLIPILEAWRDQLDIYRRASTR